MSKNNDEKLKTPKGSGCSGFWTRFWYSLIFLWVGFKWNTIEIFTRHRKLNLQKIARRPKDVAVITGGARGIGVEVIKKLLILDMEVIVGCRNEAAGNQMIENLRKQGIHTGKAHTISLDLMSLDSVRQFADKVLKKCRKIHVLINNAGIMCTPYQLTKDDLESQFQVNYLSHFLLTQLLLPKLKSTGTAEKPSRIVNVSSVAHYGGKINFEDLQMSKLYSPEMAYMTSKMMQVISTRHLENRLQSEGAHVHVYAVHPGVVKTDLYEHICCACGCCLRILFKTPSQGSDCVTYAAVSPKVADKGGNFFANCKKETPHSDIKKVEIQQKLWTISCELTGIVSSTQSKMEIPSITIENEDGHQTPSQEMQETLKENNEESRNLYSPNSYESKNPHSSNSYESRNTDTKNLGKGVATKEDKNLASNIVVQVENSSESAIVAMSVDLVNEIVEKSEDIVNKRTDTENQNFDHEKDIGSSIQVEVQESSITLTDEEARVKPDGVTADEITEPVIASTKSQDNNDEEATGNIVVVEEPEEKSGTTDYGSVQITEITEKRDSDNRLNTPDITITQASDVGSDTDSDTSVPIIKD